jgi:hypothetical protein
VYNDRRAGKIHLTAEQPQTDIGVPALMALRKKAVAQAFIETTWTGSHDENDTFLNGELAWRLTTMTRGAPSQAADDRK